MMQIECAACGTVSEGFDEVLTKGSVAWHCRSCGRLWDVRTVFFERRSDVHGDEWREKIKRLRVEQNMTQSQLARLVGVSHAYISIIESGKRTPNPSLWRRMFEALGAHEDAARV